MGRTFNNFFCEFSRNIRHKFSFKNSKIINFMALCLKKQLPIIKPIRSKAQQEKPLFQAL